MIIPLSMPIFLILDSQTCYGSQINLKSWILRHLVGIYDNRAPCLQGFFLNRTIQRS